MDGLSSEQRRAFSQRWRKTHGSVAAVSVKESGSHSTSAALADEALVLPRTEIFIYAAYRRRKSRSGFSGRRVRELIHDARDDFFPTPPDIPLASELNFSIEGGTAGVENWLVPFERWLTFECELDAAGGLADEDARAVHSAPRRPTIWLGTSRSRDFTYLNQV